MQSHVHAVNVHQAFAVLLAFAHDVAHACSEGTAEQDREELGRLAMKARQLVNTYAGGNRCNP